MKHLQKRQIALKKKSKMKFVLVTGCAGFIGSHVCERLLEQGFSVVGVDNFNDYYDPKVKENNISGFLNNNNFRLHRADIRDKKSIAEIFGYNDLDCIIHLAARAGVRPSIEQPMLYADVNIIGTINLLEAARRKGIKNFVFASSSSIYGINNKVPFSEDDIAEQQVSPYGATKKTGENYCYLYHKLYGMSIACLRFFTVYGPRGRPDMAAYLFTKLISEGKEIKMFGSGDSKRDYTYITDIVDGIAASLKMISEKGKEGGVFEIINLGNSNPVKLRRFISIIEKNAGRKAKIKKMPMQKGDVPLTYADVSKAERLLGYRPKVNIEEGIKRFVEWYKVNST